MKLVIVESPAKAKTISKFLGPDYTVAASYGHIRDLPSSAEEIPEHIRKFPWSRLAVDVDNAFTPYYVVPANSQKHVRELKKLLKNADEVVLATDEDREGEAISWHLLEILKPKVPVRRIVFHEITKPAIAEAVANPREVDTRLVRAQESRRILDRLYGYSLSPVLWKKVRGKLSAGRVQSVAVRLIVEREEERRAFRKSVYWDIEAAFVNPDTPFTAILVAIDGKKLATGKDFDPATGDLASKNAIALDEQTATRLAEAALENTPWAVKRVERREQRQRPAPPFITSTLQQAASGALGFSPERTMRIAQTLYEGIDLGAGEREGLITYMRTDSVTLSERALEEAGRVIRDSYGAEYYQGPRRYQTKVKSAQEAHEAIRPTSLRHTPEEAKRYLNRDELALYDLIWRRTLASQMADAVVSKTTVDIAAQVDGREHVFRANGSIVRFPGYLKVAPANQKDTFLPELTEGQQIHRQAGDADAESQVGKDATELVSAKPVRHETAPPARYTEASLIRKLEEEGIGRPSTYAPTMSTILQRGYVLKKGNALAPTYLGLAVVLLLREYFAQYVDVGFTARMEDALDDIATGSEDWLNFLDTFYRGRGRFGDGLAPQIEAKLPEIEFPMIHIGGDPETGEPIRVRIGRATAFIQRGEGGPENTVTIPDGLLYDELTVEKACELLAAKSRGAESLGSDPATGQPIYALEGPYGPYVQLGEAEKGKKPKRASLPKGMTLADIDLDTAARLLELPRELGAHPESGKPVKANIGPYGPYVQCDGEFRSLGEGDDVHTVTLERALELLAQPKSATRRTRATKKVLAELGEHPVSSKPVQVLDGRFGPYVTDGEKNATIPKGTAPESVTLEQALALLAEAPARKARAKRGAAKRGAGAKGGGARKPASRKKRSA